MGRAPDVLFDHRLSGGEARSTVQQALHIRNEPNNRETGILQHTA
jgi:hypothetical protein